MKVLLRGNTVLIQTDIDAEDYEKYVGYGVFTVKDDNGDEVYKVTTSDFSSNIATFGITCDTTYQGKLAMSGHFEGPVEDFKEFLQPAILALKEYGPKIQAQINVIKAKLEGIDELFVVEE